MNDGIFKGGVMIYLPPSEGGEASRECRGSHFFVDEAGDPTLFDRKGHVLVGQAGCSKTFILGKLEAASPETLSTALKTLRSELLADPYFKRVPSMQVGQKKTAYAFHAKDDVAEVRREVFRLIMNFDWNFYAVVRTKSALLNDVRQCREREPGYRYRGDEIYDMMVEELFWRHPQISGRLDICFARRGNKPRDHAFLAAIKRAETRFELNCGMRRAVDISVIASTPLDTAGLQVVDYCLWALQRYYERNEARYIELIWDRVVEIEDMDCAEGKGIIYNAKRPLVFDQEALE
jgi:hypothetical protein